jgi:hypothetical protein
MTRPKDKNYTSRTMVLGYNGIRWENGLGGSGGSERIFWGFIPKIRAKKARKIRLNPPDPPNPFSHRIPKQPNAQYIIPSKT